MKITRPARHERQYRRGFRLVPRHSGIDYGWIIGDEKSRDVLSCGTGIVRSVTNGGADNDGWGNRIIVDHTSRAYSTYNHNKTGSAKVKKNAKVRAGDVLAEQGETGEADGVHLHFELYIDNVRVDPAPYLAGKSLPGVPVIPRRTVKLTPTARVNMRKSATTKSDVTRQLKSGTTGTFDAWKDGELVTQNGVTSRRWWRAAFGGDWVWAGNMNGNETGMKRAK